MTVPGRRRPLYSPTRASPYAPPGMRPSKVAALRLGDLDLRHGTIDITKSRHLVAEHPPKTSKSERTIKLPPAVVAALAELVPLHVDPSGVPVHEREERRPIDQGEFEQPLFCTIPPRWRALASAGRCSGCRAQGRTDFADEAT